MVLKVTVENEYWGSRSVHWALGSPRQLTSARVLVAQLARQTHCKPRYIKRVGPKMLRISLSVRDGNEIRETKPSNS